MIGPGFAAMAAAGRLAGLLRTVLPFVVAALFVAVLMWQNSTRSYQRGYDARTMEYQTQELKQTALDLSQLQAAVDAAIERNDELNRRLRAENARLRSTQSQLKQSLQRQAANKEVSDEGRPLLGQCVVAADDVRLLNDARRAAAGDHAGGPAGGGHAEGRAAPLAARGPAGADGR